VFELILLFKRSHTGTVYMKTTYYAVTVSSPGQIQQKGICVEVHVVITLIPSNQPPKASLVSCTYMIELLHSTKHVALAIIFICQVVCAVIFPFLVLACLQSSLTLLLLRHCM